jgi:hypothetical protein
MVMNHKPLRAHLRRSAVCSDYAGPPPVFGPEWCALFERGVR